MEVDGISVAAAEAIQAASIVSGYIAPGTGHLILVTYGGTEIDAGLVIQDPIDLSDVTLSGTLAEFNAAMSDGNFVSLAGAETLTNKTLTGPNIDSPDVTDLTLDGVNISDEWTDWNPVLAPGWVIGNGEKVGRYKRIGTTVHWTLSLNSGTTTTAVDGTTLYWEAPIAPVLDWNAAHVVHCGSGVMRDAATSNIYNVGIMFSDPNAMVPYAQLGGSVTDGTPFTWNEANNWLRASGTYEVAP